MTLSLKLRVSRKRENPIIHKGRARDVLVINFHGPTEDVLKLFDRSREDARALGYEE